MARRDVYPFLLGGLLLFFLSGCMHVISSPLREQAKKDLTVSTVVRNPASYKGSIVIWGGRIIETQNGPEGSEILVLETPLSYDESPRDSESSRGRFIARSPQFLDPAIFREDRDITLAGEITGVETKPLGNTQYTYPIVKIKEIYLWKRTPYAYPPYPYYDWYWYGPHPYWYGPFFYFRY